MRAVVASESGPAEVLRIGEVEPPAPAPGQILIAVRAAALNRADILQREGRYPPPAGESEILGLECAGTVAAIGADVAGFAVGDRVFALLGGGGYAEMAVADAGQVLPIPASIGFEQAACMAEAYITAWLNLFENGMLRDGETVLLHGGGSGVNLAAIQLVKALCPASAIAVTASAAKHERVRAMGADLIIDYTTEDFADAVRAFTEGRGADVILDHIGAAYFERNLRSLAVNGRLVVIGILQGAETALNLGRLMVKRQRIIGSVLRSRPAAEKTGIVARFAAVSMPLFASGRIAPVIDRVYPVEAVADAHRRMEAGLHFGKIVLSFGA